MTQISGNALADETASEKARWDHIITPDLKWFDLNVRDLSRYRYLVRLFVKRDFVVFYQQTLLGPLWYLVQPLLTTLVFTVIFGKIARISTDTVPPFLFYLSGTVAWSYFSGCFNQVSNTFFRNANLFGMVYFPRLTVPLSLLIFNLVQFGIQVILFLMFYLYFMAAGAPIRPTPALFMFPLLIVQMALLGLGMGLFVSSLTVKYRDLSYVMGFIVQLWMFATPIVYPLSLVPEKFRIFYMVNPLTSVVETFRYGFLGQGQMSGPALLIGWMITLLILYAGLLIFARSEKTFMDTI